MIIITQNKFFLTSLIWVFFSIFVILRNTEILMEWNYWLRMYVPYIAYTLYFTPDSCAHGLRQPTNFVDSYLQMYLINLNFFLIKRNKSQEELVFVDFLKSIKSFHFWMFMFHYRLAKYCNKIWFWILNSLILFWLIIFFTF